MNESRRNIDGHCKQTDKPLTLTHLIRTHRDSERERGREGLTHTCKLSGGDIMFVMYAEHNMENETSDWNSDAHGI